MSTNVSSQQFESYVPIYDTVPDKWEDAQPFLVETLKKISNAVNIREIGWLLDEELLSGQQFFPGNSSANDQQFRSVLRKVIDFGPLPNATTKSVPHFITFDINFSLMQLYAAATDPVAFIAIEIPFSSPTLNENIKITMDAMNINITTGINYNSYTRVYVFISYIQEQ